MSSVLRNLPSVNDLLDRPPLKSLVRRLSHNVVVTQVGRFLDGMRSQVQSASAAIKMPTPAELAQRIADWIAAEQQPQVRPVINATGILLHPGLGGAPLAAEAVQAAAGVAASYSALDFDLATGKQTQRTQAIENVLVRLASAEAATVVNNHAGAIVLALAAVARGREVLVSRGQLVEIPGSHRLPDMVAASGAALCEVGATNRTTAADYSAAISERTAALLHVHTVNLANAGPAMQPPLTELAAVARRHKLPLIDDLGNGSVIDLAGYGIAGEPVLGESLKAGADLVLLSGERLLGGPQAGLIVGRRALVELLDKHPLCPALRADKMTIAALAATLRLYESTELAERSIPLLSLLATPLENLQNRAQRLAPQIAASGIVRVEIAKTEASITFGDWPAPAIASFGLHLHPTSGTAQTLAAALRQGSMPVIGQVQGDRLVLDLRTVFPRQDLELVAAIEALAAANEPAHRAAEIPAAE